MGLILDSSVLIAGERRDQSIRQLLDQLRTKHGETETALSVVTVIELTHGIYQGQIRRLTTLDVGLSPRKFIRDMVVHAVSFEIAQLAGRIEARADWHAVSASPSRIS